MHGDAQDEVPDEARGDPGDGVDGARTSSDDAAWTDAGTSGGAGPGALVAAGVMGALTTLVLVLVWNVLGPGAQETRDLHEPGAAVGAASSPTATDGPVSAPGMGTRLSRCAEAERALREPLAKARQSLDQWGVHVGAMNQLVVGEITLQQATQFWNRTRLGAHHRVREFGEAVTALRRTGIDCPAPAYLGPGASALPGCAREVDAQLRTLHAAQVSVATWEEHIHHMDMLRLGQMAPEEATRLWLDSWRQGVRELDAYKAAARASGRDVGCVAAPPSS